MSADPPPITWAGCLIGMRLTLPLLPGITAFSMAFGALAMQKGLSLGDAMLMSGLVFAGAAQMVAMEIWHEPLTLPVVVAVCGVCAAINLRLVLMGAALRPWFGSSSARSVYPSLGLMTDANWVIALRYHAEGGNDRGIFLGSGLLLWVVWTAATVPAHLFGTFLRDPRTIALDLVMPIFFVVMLVPMWKGLRQAMPWLVSGLVATATSALLPGYWFILTGALAGSVAGALAPQPEPADRSRRPEDPSDNRADRAGGPAKGH
ncbi:AzlC family ABC transporter permease [Prosthecodimorpha staleyi]|uniref:AzlC family ABC transporter permease n=1 Tax=Prosthecodimorpha staleyi TaxID=2840188 RepID=A0A947GEI2_9HYPH|nr:AzlC family ABC transporter permease [Prosthecodimorpha staleyi]MBT9289400.1 AzlC family ABC transporter permease [Prosthecodimorpha staleyi]